MRNGRGQPLIVPEGANLSAISLVFITQILVFGLFPGVNLIGPPAVDDEFLQECTSSTFQFLEFVT
jgi:hypothetical protein